MRNKTTINKIKQFTLFYYSFVATYVNLCKNKTTLQVRGLTFCSAMMNSKRSRLRPFSAVLFLFYFTGVVFHVCERPNFCDWSAEIWSTKAIDHWPTRIV